jgi:hypothetical protein
MLLLFPNLKKPITPVSLRKVSFECSVTRLIVSGMATRHCSVQAPFLGRILMRFSVCRPDKKNPLNESASELRRSSDCRFSTKLLPTFAETRCHVVSVKDPYGRNLDLLDRNDQGEDAISANRDFVEKF